MARHIQGILNKMVRFPIRNLGVQKAVDCYIQSAKKKSINQESYIWQN